MYSMMARESQTASPSSIRQGTRPFGDHLRKKSKLSPPGKGISVSLKGMPRAVSSTQGRSDQDE